MMKILLFFISFLFCVSCSAQDFNKPANSSTKTNFPIEIRANVNQCMIMDGSGTNLQTGFLRYNRTTDKWQEFTSPSTWTDIPLASTSLNLATDRLIGRDTAGTGASEELSLSGGLEFTGSAGVRIADGGVTEAKLDADAATRSTLLYEAQDDITAGTAAATRVVKYTGVSGSVSDVIIPKACKVTHITAIIEGGESITAGTLTFVVYKNAVTTGKDVQLSTGESDDIGDLTTGVATFAAGDALSVWVTKSSLTISSTPLIYAIQVWGHFTE